MKTHSCYRGWRRYLTSNRLFSGCLYLSIATLLVLKTFFSLQEAQKFKTFLDRKTVVRVENEVVLERKLTNDTINIYVNRHVNISEDTSIKTDIEIVTDNDSLNK